MVELGWRFFLYDGMDGWMDGCMDDGIEMFNRLMCVYIADSSSYEKETPTPYKSPITSLPTYLPYNRPVSPFSTMNLSMGIPRQTNTSIITQNLRHHRNLKTHIFMRELIERETMIILKMITSLIKSSFFPFLPFLSFFLSFFPSFLENANTQRQTQRQT